MAYSEKVLDHYENPRNVGTLDKDSPDVGTGMVGAPACGDVMKLQIEVHEGIITDASLKRMVVAVLLLAVRWLRSCLKVVLLIKQLRSKTQTSQKN